MSNEKTRLDIIVLAFTLALFLVPPVLAKKPLIGTMDLTWNDNWPGPQIEIPDWIGTITIDGVVYNMKFFNLGTGKPYDLPNPGKEGHFGEVWLITDFVTDVLVLKGTDEGVLSLANLKYRMNGVVTDTNEEFKAWMGRQVHMSGVAILHEGETPFYQAPGEFRIN
jgi:hypothetical protein